MVLILIIAREQIPLLERRSAVRILWFLPQLTGLRISTKRLGVVLKNEYTSLYQMLLADEPYLTSI
jgi:hypothetical protein